MFGKTFEDIKQDYSSWLNFAKQRGYLALHDTKVPSYNPNVANLGSYRYFESHIKFDSRFKLLDQVDSLSILQHV